jgi:hypothetical protein
MSLENRLEGVIHSIYNLFDWLGNGVNSIAVKCEAVSDSFLQKQVDVSTSNLYSLAEDCLRFTMHFFPSFNNLHHTYIIPLYPFRRSHRCFAPCPSRRKPESQSFTGVLILGEPLYEPSRPSWNISRA